MDPNGIPYSTQDTAGRQGAAGLILATIAPGQRLTLSICGENFVLQGDTANVNTGAGPVSGGMTAWLRIGEAAVLKRDGIVTL